METGFSPFYRSLLLQQFAQRQRANARFSLRSYAKLLGLQAPTLSAVLKGKRPLPAKYGPGLAKKLGLNPIERQRFLQSLSRTYRLLGKPEILPPQAVVLKNDAHHKVISQWEHYAILSLIESRDFMSDPAFIARRLNVSELRVRACLQNLTEANLIRVAPNGAITKNQADVQTTEDVLSVALQESHRDSLKLALTKLESLAVEERDFSSGILVMPLKKMPQAKQLIREFRRSFYDLIEDNAGEDVFHLCVQFFPLTQLKQTEQK